MRAVSQKMKGDERQNQVDECGFFRDESTSYARLLSFL